MFLAFAGIEVARRARVPGFRSGTANAVPVFRSTASASVGAHSPGPGAMADEKFTCIARIVRLIGLHPRLGEPAMQRAHALFNIHVSHLSGLALS